MINDRPVAAVLQDILRDLQEMIRSEARLAKAEIRDEARQTASSAMRLIAGVIVGLSAWLFSLWTAVYALANRMSMWAATLLVAIVLASAAGALIVMGLRRLKRIQPLPERTIETMKENLEWIKQSTK